MTITNILLFLILCMLALQTAIPIWEREKAREEQRKMQEVFDKIDRDLEAARK